MAASTALRLPLSARPLGRLSAELMSALEQLGSPLEDGADTPFDTPCHKRAGGASADEEEDERGEDACYLTMAQALAPSACSTSSPRSPCTRFGEACFARMASSPASQGAASTAVETRETPRAAVLRRWEGEAELACSSISAETPEEPASGKLDLLRDRGREHASCFVLSGACLRTAGVGGLEGRSIEERALAGRKLRRALPGRARGEDGGLVAAPSPGAAAGAASRTLLTSRWSSAHLGFASCLNREK
mmetsp:Transcript_77723/g.197496  ORF Transcript_77723/g.197496 Transcript_77723/m.197496 type:complete len:249 (+) Transcript_77723:153-899(+)|eukprot:CAMPEP_0183407786 /NCGR_PEP_ID=MMETSP0370-20130417/17608_1 /TAXON_ID=268820 /ORGANISM="Peridinium aciculiferum, Strain PAER-2" /LENGTH=248 /DNA_ID=CAMNT_0025590195 /DNA_START=80 /DNA_END=826 /DNA_ORIENTATION=+